MLDFYSDKIEQIESCIIGCNGEVNLWELRELALSKGGFVSRELRQVVWPILTGAFNRDVIRFNDPSNVCLGNNDTRIAVDNSVLEIIQRDVRRTVWPSHVHPQEEKEEEEEKDRQELVNIICHVLGSRISTVQQHNTEQTREEEEKELHYYQGFHDICSLIHRTLSSTTTSGREITLMTSAAVISQLCQRHFRDAMRINFNKFVRGVQLAFWPLLSQVDPTMEVHMFTCHYSSFFGNDSSAITPTKDHHGNTSEAAERQQVVSYFYADKLITPVSIVSWTMTWFASQLGNFETAATRFMDAFMASHPMMPLYVAVAFISYKRSSILCCECDFASIHMQLVRLPRTCMEDILLKRNKKTTTARTTNSTTTKDAMDGHIMTMEEKEEEEEECIDEFCQLILELAITYMKRFPPWHLIRLSKQYREGLLFRNSNPKNILLFDHSDISMFGTPASWSICSKIHCYNNISVWENNKFKRINFQQEQQQHTNSTSFTRISTSHTWNSGCDKVTNLYLEHDKPQFSVAKVASGYSEVTSPTNATAKWRQVLFVLQRHPKRRRIIRILLLYGAGLLFFAKISAMLFGIQGNVAIVSVLVPHSWKRLLSRKYSSTVTNIDSTAIKCDGLVYTTQEEEKLSITTLEDPTTDREIIKPDNKLGSLHYEKIEDAGGLFLPGDTTNSPHAEEEDTTFITSTYIGKEGNEESLIMLISPNNSNGIEAMKPPLTKDDFEERQQQQEENILAMKQEAIANYAAERDKMEEQREEVIIDQSPAYDRQISRKESKEGSCDFNCEKKLHNDEADLGFIEGKKPLLPILMQAKGINEFYVTEGSYLKEREQIPEPKYSLSSHTEEMNHMNPGGREKGKKERMQASKRSTTSSGKFKRGSRTEFFLLI
jgi:hypothetical protein